MPPVRSRIAGNADQTHNQRREQHQSNGTPLFIIHVINENIISKYCYLILFCRKYLKGRMHGERIRVNQPCPSDAGPRGTTDDELARIPDRSPPYDTRHSDRAIAAARCSKSAVTAFLATVAAAQGLRKGEWSRFRWRAPRAELDQASRSTATPRKPRGACQASVCSHGNRDLRVPASAGS